VSVVECAAHTWPPLWLFSTRSRFRSHSLAQATPVQTRPPRTPPAAMSLRLQSSRAAVTDENATRMAPSLLLHKPAGGGLSARAPPMGVGNKPGANAHQMGGGGKQGAAPGQTRRALGDISNAGGHNGSGGPAGLAKKAVLTTKTQPPQQQQIVASIKPLQSHAPSSSSSTGAPKLKQSAPVQILAPLASLAAMDEDDSELFTTGALAPVDGGHISSLPEYRDEELEAASEAFRRTAPKGAAMFSMKGRPSSPIMWQPRTDAERAEDAMLMAQVREQSQFDLLEGMDDFGDINF
jgi:hypothetical protein